MFFNFTVSKIAEKSFDNISHFLCSDCIIMTPVAGGRCLGQVIPGVGKVSHIIKYRGNFI